MVASANRLEVLKQAAGGGITPAEYGERLSRAQAELVKRDLDIGLAFGNWGMPGDVLYLTGYDPQLENSAVLISPTGAYLLGGPEGEPFAREQMGSGEWRNIDEFKIPLEEYPGSSFSTLAEVIAEATGGRPVRQVGLLTKSDVLTVFARDIVLRQLPAGTPAVDASDILVGMREQKSEAEQALMRVAGLLAAEGMRAMLRSLRPGVSELEIAAEGDYAMKRGGATSYGWDTVVLSGPRTNVIIGRATHRTIEPGDPVLLTVSPRYLGYASVSGRTLVLGDPRPEQRRFLEHGVRALELSAENLVEGRAVKYLDLAPREYLEQVGLERYHFYSSAHGTGITECLEGHPATRVSDEPLERNRGVMIDIGLFNAPGLFGARHEDPFLLNSKGQAERLSDLPMFVQPL